MSKKHLGPGVPRAPLATVTLSFCLVPLVSKWHSVEQASASIALRNRQLHQRGSATSGPLVDHTPLVHPLAHEAQRPHSSGSVRCELPGNGGGKCSPTCEVAPMLHLGVALSQRHEQLDEALWARSQTGRSCERCFFLIIVKQ